MRNKNFIKISIFIVFRNRFIKHIGFDLTIFQNFIRYTYIFFFSSECIKSYFLTLNYRFKDILDPIKSYIKSAQFEVIFEEKNKRKQKEKKKCCTLV